MITIFALSVLCFLAWSAYRLLKSNSSPTARIVLMVFILLFAWSVISSAWLSGRATPGVNPDDDSMTASLCLSGATRTADQLELDTEAASLRLEFETRCEDASR
jgi:hypothetical protein